METDDGSKRAMSQPGASSSIVGDVRHAFEDGNAHSNDTFHGAYDPIEIDPTGNTASLTEHPNNESKVSLSSGLEYSISREILTLIDEKEKLIAKISKLKESDSPSKTILTDIRDGLMKFIEHIEEIRDDVTQAKLPRERLQIYKETLHDHQRCVNEEISELIHILQRNDICRYGLEKDEDKPLSGKVLIDFLERLKCESIAYIPMNLSSKPLFSFKKIALNDYKVIFIQDCRNNHWTLIAIFPKSGCFSIISSLSNKKVEDNIERDAFMWLELRAEEKLDDPTGWEVRFIESAQQNVQEKSCGRYLLVNALTIAMHVYLGVELDYIKLMKSDFINKVIVNSGLYIKNVAKEKKGSQEKKKKNDVQFRCTDLFDPL